MVDIRHTSTYNGFTGFIYKIIREESLDFNLYRVVDALGTSMVDVTDNEVIVLCRGDGNPTK